MVMKHHCFVENGMDMAGGHWEWNRAAYVRDGADSERDCDRTLLSEEKTVGVEKDDAD
jgi:hypothetical protein